MRTRSLEKELIDLGPDYYNFEEYSDCLKKLGSIGNVLGGNRASILAFNKLSIDPVSILDVGCGGGDFTRLLAKKYNKAQVVGIDFSKEAINCAKNHPENKDLANLSFEVPSTLELNQQSKSFDIVTATLVCHHMNDNQLVDFLKRAAIVAKKAIILNDLHRHSLAYFSYYCIAPLFFRNRLITHDGLISIKRGFIKKEWISYLKNAGFKPSQYTISWEFPFRWIITIIP
jgi:2-polyprenyl-3-methyl-5-hydroxy-6-metoxy-1,4-benzoquinol methylase